MAIERCYRCHYCGYDFPTWLPVAKHPNGAMLLYHLGQHHPNHAGPYLERMRTECIATVAAAACEVVEENESWGGWATGITREE